MVKMMVKICSERDSDYDYDGGDDDDDEGDDDEDDDGDNDEGDSGDDKKPMVMIMMVKTMIDGDDDDV